MQLFKRFGFWGLAALLALACYLPVLTTEFGVHNDYSIWQYEKSSVIFDFPESPHLAAIGRPLGAILLNLHFYPIQKISDFTISRWVAFSLVLLSSLLMARQLERRVHVPPGLAACTAMCIFLLPSSELFVYWSTNLVPGALNVLLALLTYEALDKVPFAGWRSGGALSGGKVNAWLLLAALLFLCSMCIYPPTTMFILVPTFAWLVFSPIEHWPQTRRRIVRDVAFVMAGCAGYFLLTRYCLRPILAEHFPPIQATIAWNQLGRYQFSIERNVLVLLANFWDVLSVGLTSFFYPLFAEKSCQRVARAVAGMLFCLGLWRLARKPSASGIGPWVERRYLVQAGVTVLGLLFLSECPVILAFGVNGFAPYRVVFPISTMVLVLMISLASRVRLPASVPASMARPLPVMMLVAAAVLGHWVMSTAVANVHNELTYFREQLAKLDLQAVRGLTVIGPPRGILYAKGPLRAEFQEVATSECFFRGFTAALLEERGVKRGSLPVRHWHYASPADEYAMIAADTAVIDMNFAVQGQPEPWPPRKPRAVVRASAEYDGGAAHAFDCNPNSCWEASGPNNWLQVEYGRPYELAAYSVAVLHPPERMPRDWQLLGSSDGLHWSLLDRRRGESDWVSGEVRRFSLSAPARYSSYRLVFTSVRRDLIRVAEWQLLHEGALHVALQPD